MKWILITGTWRTTSKETERDVRAAVREIAEAGDGIVTGGATGVDYYALDEMLKADLTAARMRVILPGPLEEYIAGYYSHWCHPPITTQDIDRLGSLMRNIRDANPDAIFEMPYDGVSQESYDMMMIQEALMADEVYAFHAQNSRGTQYTVDVAAAFGVPTTRHLRYESRE